MQENGTALSAEQPKRVLGAVDATCIVVGAIVGVGIFFTPTKVVGLTESGTLALVAWAVAGMIALCGALAFAELGTRYHASGAQYEVLRDAYGPMPAFLFVFCNATAIQAGAAGIIAIVCAENLGAMAGAELSNAAVIGLSAALIVGVLGANIVGVKWGARIQNFTVFAKVAALLVVTALAALFGKHSIGGEVAADAAPRGEMAMGAAGLVMAAMVPAFFSYGGWQHALWISGEVREPRKNLPRAIIGGVLLVMAVYLLANWAYLRLLGAGGVAASKALAAQAVGEAWPRLGARMIAGAVALSAFGVLNAQLLSGPRLVYGMACDGRFFRAFGRLSPRFGTPVAAISLIGGMALVLLVSAQKDGIDRLLTGVVLIDSLFFVLTGAAVLVLRRKRAGEGSAIPFAAIAAVAFVLGECCVIVGAFLDAKTRVATLIGLGWIVVGAMLYWGAFRKRMDPVRAAE